LLSVEPNFPLSLGDTLVHPVRKIADLGGEKALVEILPAKIGGGGRQVRSE